MRRLIAILLALTGLNFGTIAPALAVSEAQRAYDACTESYNEEYRFKDNYKAIVSGVGSGNTHCYWTWDAQSVGDAQRSALGSCEKHYSNCYIYADSNGVAPWAKRISNMGGSDGSRENDARTGAAIGGFIAGLAGALGGGGGSYNSGGGGGGGSACTAAQRARGWSEERCIRN